MFDLEKFTLKNMTECGSVIRKMDHEAYNMEEVANKMVSYLWTNLIRDYKKERSCVLIRFFITCPFEKLEPNLQDFASLMFGNESISPKMKCMTLLASAGEKPEWNSRKTSIWHKAIPLASEHMLEQSPMISQLVKQFGLDVQNVIEPDENILVEIEQKSYNVFYIPFALGSPFVPAQENFVIPYGIKSVLGFGGMLPSGDLFVVIVFAKVLIPQHIANMFRTLALSVKMAILPFAADKLFVKVAL